MWNSRDGEEVFNWILEAAEEAGDDWDGGRVVWILRYVIQPSADSSWMNKDPFANFGDERHKLTTRLEIQKDDIQAVLPIAKVISNDYPISILEFAYFYLSERNCMYKIEYIRHSDSEHILRK